MGYLRIKCRNCGGAWEVYAQTINAGRACPHCFKEIEQQSWERQIIPAFHALDDANRELAKDHTGYHVPLFEVSYKADTARQSARKEK